MKNIEFSNTTIDLTKQEQVVECDQDQVCRESERLLDRVKYSFQQIQNLQMQNERGNCG